MEISKFSFKYVPLVAKIIIIIITIEADLPIINMSFNFQYFNDNRYFITQNCFH